MPVIQTLAKKTAGKNGIDECEQRDEKNLAKSTRTKFEKSRQAPNNAKWILGLWYGKLMNTSHPSLPKRQIIP
jgi:hypothetical protein